MDTSATSRVMPPSDVFTPRTAASATHLENPPEKTVVEVKEASASTLNERRPEVAQQADTNREHEKRYELQDRVFIYSVSDAKTGFKVVQFPSEQAVKLRAYLAEEAARNERKQDSQQEHLDIVA
jgi:uncharacterized FlaG/YvyC family protein